MDVPERKRGDRRRLARLIAKESDAVQRDCERRLKSAARGGRKVQRWGWVESTPG